MKKVVVIIALLAGIMVGRAQVPFFKEYSLLRKNEPIQVNTIFQDKLGYVWFGTTSGLFKFDGLTNQRFGLADNLKDGRVTALQEDSLGRIWMGFQNGKISYFTPNGIRSFEPREGSSSEQISKLLFDRKGRLWYSTYNDGLYYFMEDRLYRLDDQEGLPDLFIYDMVEDDEGNIWAGTDGGVAICSLRGKKVSIKVLNNTNGLPDNIIKKMVPGKNHTMWLATEDAGIFNYDPSTGKFNPLIKGSWKYGSISDFVITDDRVWIACRQAGLVMNDVRTGETKVYNSTTASGFASINSLLKDSEGNVWIGTRTGVIRTPGDELEYIDDFGSYKDHNVVAVTIDHQGATWFATHEGLFRRSADAEGNKITIRQLNGTPFQKLSVISLFVDSTGYVWAGLYGEGVLRIHPTTGKLTYLNHELRNGNILNITGRGNTIWLATLGGGSRIRIERETLRVQNFGSTDGLSTDYIYQVFMDSQHRVWFATDGKGVDMLDASGFHHFDKGLNSKVVYGFAEDGAHSIWANVLGDGVYKFNGDAFQLYQGEARLRDNNINGFTSDRLGRLIILHDLGIDVYDSQKGTVRYLAEEVGLHDRRANLNAVGQDDQGHLFFGTDQGIIKYSERPEGKTRVPRPVVSGLKLFDKPVDVNQKLDFSYDENDITVSFIGLWFQNPEILSFQYKLDNYDRDWISTRDHAVTYSSLPSGNYTFLLKVSDNEDFNDAPQSALSFVIAPPFWRTMWFFILVASVAIFIGYSFIRYRERRLQADNRILEDRVKQRTYEIQLKNEEIQAQNEAIQSQAEEINGINENLEHLVRQRTLELEKKNKSLEEYAFINAHELRAPVASILGLINLMNKMELKPEEKIYLEHLQKSADRLDDVCNSITRAIERGD